MQCSNANGGVSKYDADVHINMYMYITIVVMVDMGFMMTIVDVIDVCCMYACIMYMYVDTYIS